MFLPKQPKENVDRYSEYLGIVGSLSELFSDSEVPYLYYRVAEKIFCRSFSADDLSRSDVSADAKKDKMGIGLKTFLKGNNKTFQKVAEFNNDRPSYYDLGTSDLITRVSALRNRRISFTEDAYGISNSIYHCVVRDKGIFRIFEESMDKVIIESITDVKKGRNSITFNDGLNEYSFLLSKSTLQKRFITTTLCYEFEVEILKDPIQQLKYALDQKEIIYEDNKRIRETIYLPLYGKDFKVYPRSGLNQWNAKGRDRHADEAYIPIPIFIHKTFPDFFPDRETSFFLHLPTGEKMKTKVCQENGKALMSYSNRELGKWILRTVLRLDEEELLTYEKLQEIGIDSVRIDKVDSSEYEISFSKLGSFEKFKNYYSL